jgi:Fic family protein
MSDLEKLLNNDDLQVPPLIRVGIAHFQFESIHPFPDGDGRSGRLFVITFQQLNVRLGALNLLCSAG